jgi:quercetin dioxygenase-like cupin family protein
MTLVRHADCRRTETPNGVMTTLASPTQGASTGLALWRADMDADRRGPRHAADAEQVWSFLEGTATIDLGGREFTVAPGDTVVMPADVPRQVTTPPESGFVAVVTAPAGSEVYIPHDPAETGERCELAPKGDERLVPLWAR